MKTTNDNLKKMQDIINDIYDYAKFGSGKKQLVDYGRELTTLIESEKEKAVNGFFDHLFGKDYDGGLRIFTPMNGVTSKQEVIEEYLRHSSESIKD